VVLQLGGWARSQQPLPVKIFVKKHAHAGCLLWRQNNPEVNYTADRISGGWGVGRSASRVNIAQHTIQVEGGMEEIA